MGGRDEGDEDASDTSSKSLHEAAKEPPKKRRGGIRVALKSWVGIACCALTDRLLYSKVGILENQMQQVQSSLDNVVTLLQQRLPGPSIPSDSRPSALPMSSSRNAPANTLANFSLEQWVQQVAPPITDYPQIRPSTSESAQGNSTHLVQGDLLDTLREASPVQRDSTDQGSDDEEAGSDHTEGLGLMRGMLKQDASRRLVADGHSMGRNAQTGSGVGDQGQSSQPFDRIITGLGKTSSGNKRSRSAAEGWTDTASVDKGKRRATTSLDPIHLGLCTEHEGARLFDL